LERADASAPALFSVKGTSSILDRELAESEQGAEEMLRAPSSNMLSETGWKNSRLTCGYGMLGRDRFRWDVYTYAKI
jgi:hypothetical protein